MKNKKELKLTSNNNEVVFRLDDPGSKTFLELSYFLICLCLTIILGVLDLLRFLPTNETPPTITWEYYVVVIIICLVVFFLSSGRGIIFFSVDGVSFFEMGSRRAKVTYTGKLGIKQKSPILLFVGMSIGFLTTSFAQQPLNFLSGLILVVGLVIVVSCFLLWIFYPVYDKKDILIEYKD